MASFSESCCSGENGLASSRQTGFSFFHFPSMIIWLWDGRKELSLSKLRSQLVKEEIERLRREIIVSYWEYYWDTWNPVLFSYSFQEILYTCWFYLWNQHIDKSIAYIPKVRITFGRKSTIDYLTTDSMQRILSSVLYSSWSAQLAWACWSVLNKSISFQLYSGLFQLPFWPSQRISTCLRLLPYRAMMVEICQSKRLVW